MLWEELLDDFGRSTLKKLGYGPDYLPSDRNPIIEALKDSSCVEMLSDLPGFGKAALSRVAVICQMVVYDREGGPDGDGKRKGLRRQWYAWYKTRFAIPFSNQLADNGDEQEQKGFDGTIWSGRLSQTFAEFVDTGKVTYWDLWVEDASRMMDKFWGDLIDDLHIVLCVEKDSLFADFKDAAKLIGAQALVSGKGKQSKAATEKMLRDVFSIQWNNPFTAEHPLYVLHISDYDMDGEAVIGPTFGEQCRRYTPHVVEGRVGIEPDSFRNEYGELDENSIKAAWYETKTTNGGYVRWSEEKALFEAGCRLCEHRWLVQGSGPHICPLCGADTSLVVKIKGGEQPFGFEVEALSTGTYYRLIAEALLKLVPFETIVNGLRDACKASARNAAEEIVNVILENNEDYARLLAEFDRLEKIKSNFEEEIKDALFNAGQPHIEDWRDDGDDPEPEDFVSYVAGRRGWQAWRPFEQSDRTTKLVQFLYEEQADLIDELTASEIEF